ncbi:MAG: hypothetical protein PHY92_06595 [Alphaproteobacteria bacterium]|nr:hypothetical protein [Alphaproteobacteria bacterium]
MTDSSADTTISVTEQNSEAGNVQQSPLNWLDQDGLLREMWLRNEKPSKIAGQLGRSVAAIMTRAARLGLPRRSAPGRKPGYQRKDTVRKAAAALSRVSAPLDRNGDRDVSAEPGMHSVRVCLMCLNRFPSEGRHNRICPGCKGSANYNSGSSIPDMFKDA